MKKRTCWMCHRKLNLSAFNKLKTDPLGVQRCCRECGKIRMRAYAESNREYFRNKSRNAYRKEDNRSRYLRYRESFLKSRKAYAETVSGRAHSLISAAKNRAKITKVEISITPDWVVRKFKEQGGKCLLTGLHFKLSREVFERPRLPSPFGMSLDRINWRLGYSPSNTRLVCTAINLGMNRFGEVVFEKVAKAFLAKKRQK